MAKGAIRHSKIRSYTPPSSPSISRMCIDDDSSSSESLKVSLLHNGTTAQTIQYSNAKHELARRSRASAPLPELPIILEKNDTPSVQEHQEHQEQQDQPVLKESKFKDKGFTVNVAGPYTAPTISALRAKILIIVGGGVAITPFLSYLEALVSQVKDAKGDSRKTAALPKAAHFFWTTRNASDLLFAEPLLLEILGNPDLSKIIYLHLHLTTKLPQAKHNPKMSGTAAAQLFREAIAMSNETIKKDKSFDNWPRSKDYDLLYLEHTINGKATWLPISFGRPKWREEFYFIGRHHGKYHVNVYACGGDNFMEALQAECDFCNARNSSEYVQTVQRFHFTHERFDD